MSTLFIVNPLSQRVAQKGARLTVYAQSHNIQLHELRDFASLPELVTQAIKAKIKHVFIEGGDGTAQGVLSAFLQQSDKFDSFPNFAIIAGGMTNQVAKNIGLKPSAIKATIETAALPVKAMPLLNIQTHDGRAYNGFLFSTGAVPMVTEYTKSKLHKRGIGGSLAVAGGILKGISASNGDVLSPTQISLKCNDPHIDINKAHIGTLVTTLPGLIMGLDPFWGVEAAPLRLTYVDEAYSKLYRNVASLWAGNKSKDRMPDGLRSWNVHQLDYQYTGPCVLDGEPLDTTDGAFMLTATQAINFIQAG